MAFTLAPERTLPGGGIDLVEVRGADETLDQRDMRTVRGIQGEALRVNLKQPSVVGCGMLEHRGVRFQQNVDGGDRGLRDREDLFPIGLHADHDPIFLLRLLIQCGREGAQFDVRQSTSRTIGVFARCIVMQHQQFKVGATAAPRVFQHFLVAAGVTKGGDGTAADVPVDGDGFAILVVIKVQFRQTHEHGLAVAHFEFRLDAAANDLFRRDAVHLSRPRAHELDAAAGDDEVLKTVGPQIGEKLKHRLIGHFGEEPTGLRMLRGGDPILDDLLELHGGHARVCGHDDFEEWAVTAGKRRLQVALEQRGERLLGLPLRVLRCERFHPVERKIQLHGNRLLGPKRAVVVEGGDPLGRRDERRRTFLRHLFHEADDSLLRSSVVPGGERVGGKGRAREQQQTEQDLSR